VTQQLFGLRLLMSLQVTFGDRGELLQLLEDELARFKAPRGPAPDSDQDAFADSALFFVRRYAVQLINLLRLSLSQFSFIARRFWLHAKMPVAIARGGAIVHYLRHQSGAELPYPSLEFSSLINMFLDVLHFTRT